MERARRIRTTVAMLGALLALSPLVSGSSVIAQSGEKRAGLVLQFADGSTKTYCVAFAEESISGLDLLLKTGLDVRVESFGGAGALICKIGPDGCDFPEQACVCQSYGPGGVYWSYHHLKEGIWKTSGVGISSYRLHDGDVDGLAWSAGKPPPLFTFSQICANVGAQSPTQLEPTVTKRPPDPVPTQPLPTFTPEPLQPEPTREPTLAAPTVRPSNTGQPVTRASTPSRTPRLAETTGVHATVRVTDTVRLPAASSTLPVQLSTSTAGLTSLPNSTGTFITAPTQTLTSQPITPGPASTNTAVPTQAPVTPTPVLAVIDARSDTSEGMARNIALGIGIATLAGLVGWGIWRGRRNRGQNVG